MTCLQTYFCRYILCLSTDIFVLIKLKWGKLFKCFETLSKLCLFIFLCLVIPFKMFGSASHCWQMRNCEQFAPSKLKKNATSTLSFSLSIYGLSAINTQNDCQADSATKQTKTNSVHLIFYFYFIVCRDWVCYTDMHDNSEQLFHWHLSGNLDNFLHTIPQKSLAVPALKVK